MTDLIKDLFSGFTDGIEGLTGGIKEAFMNLLYVDPTASTPVLSPVIQFAFIFGGLSLAIGLVWKIFGMIRGKSRGR